MSSNPKEGVPVPCLHRIHSDVPKGPHAIHQSIGMSLEFSVIHEKLTHLNNDVSEMGASIYATSSLKELRRSAKPEKIVKFISRWSADCCANSLSS